MTADFSSKLKDPPCQPHGILGFCLKCSREMSELPAIPDPRFAPLIRTANGDAGDYTSTCSGCGEERDDEHPWKSCVEKLRVENVRLYDALVEIQVCSECHEVVTAPYVCEVCVCARQDSPDEVTNQET